MSSLNRGQVPEAMQADLRVAFKEGLEVGAQDTSYRNLLMVEPTTSNAKDMVFYGDKGRLRRWRGERQPQGFSEYRSRMSLDKWEFTITVPRDVLSDDQSGGVLRNKVTNFGKVIESSKEAETWEFLHNGTSLKGFDKANLFDFNHRYVNSAGVTNSAVAAQANMHLGGSQLDSTTIQLEQEYYSNIKSDKNKPLGMRLTHIAVRRGSANAKAARELSNSQYTVEASTVKGQMTENVFKGAFNIVEFDYGFGASEWLSMDLSSPDMKPIVVLSHSIDPGFDNLEYTQLLEDAETGFWRDELAFGVKGRFDWNVGDWRTVFLHGSSAYTFTAADSESQRPLDPNA